MRKEIDSIVEIMYLAANSDGNFKPIEERVIFAKINTYLPVFKGTDQKQITRIKEELRDRIKRQSLEQILDYYTKNISDSLKITAYAYALEICARDFELHDAEIRFLKLLYSKFKIPKSAHQALLKSINIRCITKFDTTDIF